jgi:hypothetical protein
MSINRIAVAVMYMCGELMGVQGEMFLGLGYRLSNPRHELEQGSRLEQ